MKKVLFGITLLLALTGCDDGDVTVDNINFDDVLPNKCSDTNLLYKFNDNDALLLDIADVNTFNAAFANDETVAGTPRNFIISTTSNKVIYRAYDGMVSSSKFCGSITDANPSVTEEWIASSGVGEIVTTAVKTIDATTGFERITKYNHYIVFKNITFQKPNGEQTYESFIFGSYQTAPTPLAFGFDEADLAKSTCDNRLFNINGTEALELNLAPATYSNLFQNTVTTTPRTAVLSATNTLKYKLFSTIVTNNYFCTTPTASSPVLLQEWIALNGVTNVSGIIEVTTTTSGPQFQHSVHLKKVTFRRGNSQFQLGEDFSLGVFYTN